MFIYVYGSVSVAHWVISYFWMLLTRSKFTGFMGSGVIDTSQSIHASEILIWYQQVPTKWCSSQLLLQPGFLSLPSKSFNMNGYARCDGFNWPTPIAQLRHAVYINCCERFPFWTVCWISDSYKYASTHSKSSCGFGKNHSSAQPSHGLCRFRV